jgi:CPA2 family monovalent cation:H+ antiporter-2
MVLGAVVALFLVKALTAAGAALALGERLGIAVATGLTLAQVGEFSFVLAASGAAEGLTPAGLGADGTQAFIAATVLLMAATPWLSGVGVRFGERMTPVAAGPSLAGRDVPEAGSGVADGMSDHVVVAGYGRWGRGVTRVLAEAGIPQVVTTLSPHGAVDAYDQGLPVLLGDPARLRTLTEAGVERAGRSSSPTTPPSAPADRPRRARLQPRRDDHRPHALRQRHRGARARRRDVRRHRGGRGERRCSPPRCSRRSAPSSPTR